MKYTSTGTTADAFRADLGAMVGLLQSWRSPVWIGRPKLISHLCTTFGAVGYQFPNIMGYPTLASTSSPQQLCLCDLGDILLADSDQVEIVLAQQASVVMDTDPQSSPMTTSLVSLFQRNLCGLRCVRTLSWLLGHAAACVTMQVNY